ncbi:MAG: glycerol-3-phosphate dehydrogenase/oxidase [Candidatus Brachytrichaceae bacterium NZ_4S206]
MFGHVGPTLRRDGRNFEPDRAMLQAPLLAPRRTAGENAGMDAASPAPPFVTPPHRGAAGAARAEALAALAAERFELIVVGGGITGAGVAREAALRGLRVALLERDDFAAGTSSRSSRLIHGGVRYLEHGHLGLVFEASRERRRLLALAPHLVRPLAFTWPVYHDARVPRWKLRAGLALYDALALFRNVRRHRGLSVAALLDGEPELARDGLVGGARYWDAATDDTRLTLSTTLAAREAGATIANHAEVVAGITERGVLDGLVVRDTLTDERLDVRAPLVLNCTGPWSDATAALTGLPAAHAVHGAVGAHLLVPRHRVGNRDAITLTSPVDGRVMFVLPAGAHALIGTTERPVTGGPDDVRASGQEVAYLLRSVNARFPYAGLTTDDVISAWAGIRPLAVARTAHAGAPRDTGSASREHAVVREANGLVSVTGGKLTTWRSMAEDIVTRATGRAATRAAAERSREEPLPGGDVISRAHTVHDAGVIVHDHAVAERLAEAYGSRWHNVWSYAQRDPSLRSRVVPDLPYLHAELAHAIERESACTLADLLVRRTHVAYETRDHGVAAAERIAPLAAALLGWSDAQRVEAVAAYRRDVARLFTIDGP